MLVSAAILAVLTTQALGAPALRESVGVSLGYLPRVGFLQTGLLTHWMIDTTAQIAAVNAFYALLAGSRIQADFGRIAAAGMFLLGAVLSVAAQTTLGRGADAPMLVGASGAVALWMGVSAIPYSLAAPELAWGTVGIKELGLRLPYVAVVVAWFLHQGIAMVLTDSGQEQAGHAHAAYLAEFAGGIAIGLAARWIKALASKDAAEAGPAEPTGGAAVHQLLQATEMVHKRPKLAAQMLQQILQEDRTNVDASKALLDALYELNDRAGVTDEAVSRISMLVRKGRGRQAASIYEHVREMGAEGKLAARLSATIVSALMEALAKSRAVRSAEVLGQSWYASHARDPDAWRVKEALALLHKKLET